MATSAKRIVVHGRVQGVGFRYFVQRVAGRLGLTGNVANLPDATVEIIVQGDEDLIGEFVREVGKGPSLSRVERLEAKEIGLSSRYKTFQIEGW